MPVQNVVAIASGTSTGTSAETVIATIPVLAGVGVPIGMTIQGMLAYVAGTSTTLVTVRVRQGGLTGTQVGNNIPATVVATNTYNIGILVQDLSGYPNQPVGNAQYVVTIQQTGGAAAGTVNGYVMTED